MRNALERGDPRKFKGQGFAFWFRADLGITIVTGVSQWADQSGSGNHLAQVTAGLQPLLVTNQMNGKPVVRGDGVDDWMQAVGFTLNQPETVLATYRINTRGTLNNHDILIDGGNTARMIIADDTTTNTFLHAGGNMVLGSAVANGAFAILVAIFNGASSVARVNGSQVATGDPSTQNAGGLTLFTLGFPTVARTIAADMAELIGYSTVLPVPMLKRLEHYKGARAAIAA